MLASDGQFKMPLTPEQLADALALTSRECALQWQFVGLSGSAGQLNDCPVSTVSRLEPASLQAAQVLSV
ncbi:hypothetical protein EAH79_12075 [Sphingomonas koreensis]|nr:hypothetical protein EAH79_12075 [Sphingomonas koreensis]